MKKLLYFGCIRNHGHFLFDFDAPGGTASLGTLMKYFPNENIEFLKGIDGKYCPPMNIPEGKYLYSQIGNFKIIGWNDYSIDSRPGSNSNLIGYEYNYVEEIISDAHKQYPSVMKRQKYTLSLHEY